MSLSRRTLLAALYAVTAQQLGAQGAPSFPHRPVKIVPFGTAGGPIDTLARIYGDKLQQRWGQPIVVETRPGASGIIAADYVAKAVPDGYTVMMTLPLTHVNNAILQPKLPYDPVKSFTPLSMLAVGGPMVVVRANAPICQEKGQLKLRNLGQWVVSSPLWRIVVTANRYELGSRRL